jgi:type IV pilus assembly protein PilM
MPERVVGLDVGARAVRVAEVEPGPRPVLRTFGQVDLPAGAVENGEVVDVDVVADAIRRLWKETGLRGRTARVGLATGRLVVRTIELPAVPDDEVAGSLEFQAQDYVPFPLDEAILDFHVLERVDGDNGEPIVRILLAAAPRTTVTALLAAVDAAGITATGVDLLPLALIRGLRPVAGEPGSAEAIVSVGANVTTVVIHEAGLPKVIRIVAAGGDSVTEAGLAEVTGPIQSSLDYYLNQHDVAPLIKVLLTGGGSRIDDLAETLAASLGLSVEHAEPREMIDVGDIGISEEQLSELDPYLPVAIGLALGGPRADGARIDLLPPAARRRAAGRQMKRRLSVAAAIVVLVMAGLSLLQMVGAARQRERLASQQRVNSVLQTEIDTLSKPLQGEQDLTLARQGVTAALAGDVSWPRVLEDLAGTIPEGVWLTSFGVQRTAAGPAGAAAVTGSAEIPGAGAMIGTASFSLTGMDFPAVASWLDRLPRIPYYLDLFVSSATKGSGGPTPLVTFTSSANVGPAAGSDRLGRTLAPQ